MTTGDATIAYLARGYAYLWHDHAPRNITVWELGEDGSLTPTHLRIPVWDDVHNQLAIRRSGESFARRIEEWTGLPEPREVHRGP